MRKKRGRYGMRWILRQGEENQESEKEKRSERDRGLLEGLEPFSRGCSGLVRVTFPELAGERVALRVIC